MVTNWNRRQAITVMGAALSGCVGTREVAGPPILINLSDPAPEEPGADLASGHDSANRMTAPAFINGQGPFNFVVDTGANRTVLSTELALLLELPSAGTAQIHGIAGVQAAPTVQVNRLSVGTVTSRRLRAPTLQRARLGADGLLGVDFLKNRSVLMDFAKNQLTISKLGNGEIRTRVNAIDGRLHNNAALDAALSRVIIVPARFRFGQLIIIDAEIAGVPITAFLDSGSQNTVGNLALHSRLRGAAGGLQAGVSTVELISATGQRASGELASVPPLRLGGLSIGNLSAVFADLHVFGLWDLLDRPAILIGIDVMRHFEAIELDFANHQVLFRTPLRRVPP